jgi:predicted DNA-binding transcriptional regulator AlpA
MATAHNHCSTETTGRHLTDVEVAKHFGVSVSTVRRWRRVGGGPRWVRVGSSIRYSVPDLEAYVASLPSGGGTNDTKSSKGE